MSEPTAIPGRNASAAQPARSRPRPRSTRRTPLIGTGRAAWSRSSTNPLSPTVTRSPAMRAPDESCTRTRCPTAARNESIDWARAEGVRVQSVSTAVASTTAAERNRQRIRGRREPDTNESYLIRHHDPRPGPLPESGDPLRHGLRQRLRRRQLLQQHLCRERRVRGKRRVQRSGNAPFDLRPTEAVGDRRQRRQIKPRRILAPLREVYLEQL